MIQTMRLKKLKQDAQKLRIIQDALMSYLQMQDPGPYADKVRACWEGTSGLYAETVREIHTMEVE